MTAATKTTPTTRQLEIRDYIATYSRNTGFPPTVREIGKAFGIRSPNGVMCHLHPLRDRGLVTWIEGKQRTLRVVGEVA